MTAVGMILMILGIIIIAVAWNSNPRSGKLIGIGAMLTLAGMLIGIGGNPAKDMPNGSPGMVAMGFALAIFGIVLIVMQISAGKKAHNIRAAQILNNTKIEFYKDCVQHGITECVSEKEIQKATLIAQKRSIPFSDISALFYESRALVDKDSENKRLAALNEQREKEKSACAALDRYAEYSGRDKLIAILTAEKNEALSSAQTLRSGASALIGASQQKEHDWAVLGGIANGIAGPAAGVATAMDIQAKNAQIRAQNQANLEAFAPIMLTSYEGAAKHEQRAAAIGREIEEIKTKLIGKEDAAACLEYLTFTNTNIEVSSTGSCTVTATAALKKPVTIFGDVDAFVDGTVIAKIYDGKNFVGAANMVIPRYGIRSSVNLKGVCLFCAQPGKKYTVSYTAKNMWTMEK